MFTSRHTPTARFATTLFLTILSALAFAGPVSAQPGAQPTINVVHFALDPVNKSVTAYVFGSGFGQFPGTLPDTADINYFIWSDLTTRWNYGNASLALCPANNACGSDSMVPGNYVMWSNTEIEAKFSTGVYGWKVGDNAYIGVANPQSGKTATWKGELTNYTVAPAASSSAVTGTWVGSYECVQGKTGLRLTISRAGANLLDATFAFYALPSNPGVPSGSYKMTGEYTGSDVQLTQDYWIKQPSGYAMVNLDGEVRGGTFSGSVPYAGCGTFSLTKLVAPSIVVNGFVISTNAPLALQNPYSVAERQMLARLPSDLSTSSYGAQVARLTAASAEQTAGGAGLLITWNVEPTSRYIADTAAQRQTAASALDSQLLALLRTSVVYYDAALRADRVPLQGSSDLANWWVVAIRSTSTTDESMGFQVGFTSAAQHIPESSWTNIPGYSDVSGGSPSGVLASLLYYTKQVIT
jgi:hypothetical protein